MLTLVLRDYLVFDKSFSVCLGVGCQVSATVIPNSAVELCERCFDGCVGLQRVTFRASSKLECTCAGAFSGADAESLAISDGVVDRCFMRLSSACYRWRPAKS